MGIYVSTTPDGDSYPSNGLVIDALKAHINGIDTDTCEAGEEDSFHHGILEALIKQEDPRRNSMESYPSTTADGDSYPSNGLVIDALKTHISGIDTDTCEAGEEDSFFVADLDDVYRQHLRWKKNLKRVTPYYAVKCNPDPGVLRLLAALGIGFDCASKNEIEQILKLGVDPSKIIYANPCKTKSYIRYARQEGVKQTTFDSVDELYKIKALYPDAELFLRISTDDASSLCSFSVKFGASHACTRKLLQLAKQLNLNVVGVSFHVGSGAKCSSAFLKAVQDSRNVFNEAAGLGYDLKILDIGGGFLEDGTFEKMACVLNAALDRYFPADVHIIGEPGHYYVSAAFTLACNIIARKESSDGSYMLYLNDGVYGSFLNHLLDRERYDARVLFAKNDGEGKGLTKTKYSIWGPTLDGIDLIAQNLVFVRDLRVGDWLYFKSMGAYTMSCSTNFNGFSGSHKVLYVFNEPAVSALLGRQRIKT
ncbi:hypothetical protein MMC07_001532 [Pseudocyphellaria aurata]|nr:hypothetical protein [Pseudocyphellaria aurata]